jgi:hypothetical protein
MLSALSALAAQVGSMNADIQAKLDALSAKVAAENTVIGSGISLLQGLAAEVAALKSTTTDPAVLAAIDNVTSGIDAKTQELAAAIVANTPTA